MATLTTSCVDRSGPEPPAPTTGIGQACPESGRTVEVGPDDAAMGLRVIALTLTNCGDESFTLNGYPRVRVLDEGGAEVPVTVLDGAGDIALVPEFDNPPAPITVRPGDTATSGILWRNLVTGAGPAVTGYALEVRPVDGDPPQRLAEDDLHIDLGDTGRLGVRAWSVSP
jgi:hypothetical protein